MTASFYSEDELLPLSGLQHFAFCRRQWALIHLEQQWEENLLTVEGRLQHERADDAKFVEKRADLLTIRAVPLVSRCLGLSGRADVVEFLRSDSSLGVRLEGRQGFWRPSPVEYKHGKQKAADVDRVQLCAQAICLEEMLQANIQSGSLFYWETRSREPVCFDTMLRQRVEQLSADMHSLFRQGRTPLPEKRPGCRRCSLQDKCLPQLEQLRAVRSYLQQVVDDLGQQGGGGRA